MERSIIQYLQTMGVIAAPIKATDTAPVEPKTPEQLLEGFFRFLLKMLILMFAPIGLILLGISMMPTVIKPMVLQGALLFLDGVRYVLEVIAVGLSAVLIWLINIGMLMVPTYW